jgi:hypothetical protein
MPDTTIYIGDLVAVKKELQRFISLPEWGIVIDETTIIPSDLPEDEEMDPIDSWVVFFPNNDDTLTIPKNCLKKIVILDE